jgi:hypothetical protein
MPPNPFPDPGQGKERGRAKQKRMQYQARLPALPALLLFKQLLQAADVFTKLFFSGVNREKINCQNDPNGHIGGKKVMHGIHKNAP